MSRRLQTDGSSKIEVPPTGSLSSRSSGYPVVKQCAAVSFDPAPTLHESLRFTNSTIAKQLHFKSLGRSQEGTPQLGGSEATGHCRLPSRPLGEHRPLLLEVVAARSL